MEYFTSRRCAVDSAAAAIGSRVTWCPWSWAQQLAVAAAGAAEVGIAVVDAREVAVASRSVGSAVGQGTSGAIVRMRQKTDIA